MQSKFVQDRAPPVPDGWKSASQLVADGYVGGVHALRRRIASLQAVLIEEAMARGHSEDQAIAETEANFIGMKRRATGPEALYASPEATRMLALKHKSDPRSSDGRYPDHWRTTVSLEREFRASRKTIGKRLRDLQATLIDDMGAAGIEEDVARAVLEHHYIKSVKRRFDHPPVMLASEAAVELLENQGSIKRRWAARIASCSEEQSQDGLTR